MRILFLTLRVQSPLYSYFLCEFLLFPPEVALPCEHTHSYTHTYTHTLTHRYTHTHTSK